MISLQRALGRTSTDPAERRSEARTQVNRPAVLIQGFERVSCLLVDTSDHGFKLRLGSDRELGDAIELIDVQNAVALLGQVAWRRQREAGVRLTHRVRLTGMVASPFVHLRTAYLQLA